MYCAAGAGQGQADDVSYETALLITDYLEHDLSADGYRQLARILESSEVARNWFLKQVRVHRQLQLEFNNGSVG